MQNRRALQTLSRAGIALAVALAGIAGQAHAFSPETAKPAPTPAPPASPAPAAQPSAPASTPAPAPGAPANPGSGAAPAAPPEAALSRTELPGGVVVEEITLGTGRAIDEHSVAAVMNYRAYLADKFAKGEEFDSSYKRIGHPIVFATADLVDGLREGLMGMKLGGKRRLTIPAPKAFGAAGLLNAAKKAVVPANASVVYVVEPVNELNVVDLIPGTGEAVGPNAVIGVNYKGTLVEGGAPFDSNTDEKAPSQFSIRGVVPGWSIGLNGMKVGGKRHLVVPWQLGYGEDGDGRKIPGRADLNFEVDLRSATNLSAMGAMGGPNGGPIFAPVSPPVAPSAPVAPKSPEAPKSPTAPEVDPASENAPPPAKNPTEPPPQRPD
ncbi:hypothetical protein BH11PLA1_BH11PLA1_15210 [soil metagenome]